MKNYTVAGCLIAVWTLSGTSQSIAAVASLVAAVLHVGNVMAENDIL